MALRMVARRVGVLLVVLLGLNTQAQAERKGYYGADFLKNYQNNALSNQELLQTLFKILTSGHKQTTSGVDTIVDSCGTTVMATGESCTQHNVLGYDGARRLLFGKLFLQQNSGVYSVKDVYCEHEFTDQDFNGKPSIGPDRIPGDGSILNTEHTWPQSRFTGRFNKEMQKSDVHHLFPTDSQMNSHRSNLRFGNVIDEVEDLKCAQGKLGHQSEGGIVFEAPDQHKGNVARAIFYFATRYQMKVSPAEEAALRTWNRQDPVDAAEMERNDNIEKIQGNRNPFIDFPDMIDHIDAFKY